MSEDLGLQLNISIPTVKEVREQMLIMQDKAPIALQRAINNTIKQVYKNVGKEAKQQSAHRGERRKAGGCRANHGRG